jgi:hypothetical protein
MNMWKKVVLDAIVVSMGHVSFAVCSLVGFVSSDALSSFGLSRI